MADFQAQVKAILDPKSVSDIAKQIEDAVKNVKLNGVNLFSDLSSQAQRSGQNIGKQLANGIQSSLSNIRFKNDFLGDMSKVLMQSGFSHGAISNVTKDLENMSVAISKITTTSRSNNSLTFKIQGIDEFGRAVSLTKEFDRNSGNVVSSTKQIQQSFVTATNSAKTYAREINEAAKAQQTLTKSQTLANDIASYMNKNSEATEKYKATLTSFMNTLNNSNTSSTVLSRISSEFSRIKSEINLAKSSAEQFNASTAGTLSKIDLKIETGDFESKLNKVKESYNSLSQGSQQLASNIGRLQTAFQTMSSNTATDEERVAAYERFNAILPTVTSQLSQASSAEKAFANETKAAQAEIDATANAIKDLNGKLEIGDISTKMANVQKSFNGLRNTSDLLKSNIEKLKTAFLTLSDKSASDDARLSAYKEFNSLLPTVTAQIRQTASAEKELSKATQDTVKQQRLLTNASTLSNNMEAWLNNNKKAAKEYGDQIRQLQEQLKNPNLSQGQYQQISANFRKIQSEAKAAGLTVSQFGINMKSAIKFALGIGSVYQAFNTGIRLIKDMTNEVIKLDDAMTQFKIVTQQTEGYYQSFYSSINQIAKSISASQADLIDSATTYARLGYSGDESKELAKFTSMLKNVGDIDVSSAQNALTAITKSYGVLPDEIESIMDRLVKVGNNAPISVAELAEGINNAGSMLAASGNSFNDSLALLTAANTTVQNISKSSTGLRTIAARIRNTKTELDDLGETMTKADYEALVKSLTDAKVALTDNGEFRSTKDILADLAHEWENLGSMQQAALAKTISGTRQQNIFFSLMENWEEAEKAFKLMDDSAGTLSDSYNIYLDSVTAHIDKFKAAWTELSNATVSTDFLKGIADAGTKLLDILGKVSDKIGVFPTLVAGMGIAVLIKNFASATQGAKSFSDVFSNLGKSLTANPFALAAGGITALIATISALNQAHEQMIRKGREAAEAYTGTKTSVEEYLTRAQELQTKLADSNTSESEAYEIKKELIGIEESLVGLLGNEASQLDLVNKGLDEQIGLVNQLTEADWNKFVQGNISAINEAVQNFTQYEGALGFGPGTYRVYAPKRSDLRSLGIDPDQFIADFEKEVQRILGFDVNIADLIDDSGWFRLNFETSDINEVRDIYSQLSSAVESLGKQYLNTDDVLNTVIGKGTLANYGYQLTYLDNIMSKHQPTFDAYVSDLVKFNKQYSNVFDNIIKSEQEYENALKDGDQEAVKAALSNFEEAKVSFYNADFDNPAVNMYIQGIIDAIEAEVHEAKLKIRLSEEIDNSADFKKSVKDSINHFINDEGNFDLTLLSQAQIDYQTTAEGAKLPENAQVYQNLISIAEEYGYVTQDNVADVDALISVLGELGVINLDNLVGAVEEVDEAAETAVKSFGSFTELVGDTSDDGFAKHIESYKKAIDTLKSALSSLNADTMKPGDLIDLSLTFPELAPYINDTDQLKKKILELIEVTGTGFDGYLDEIIEASPEAKAEVEALRKSLLELANVANTSLDQYGEAYQPLINGLSAVKDMSKGASEELQKLNEVMSGGDYDDGMEARVENFKKMQELYKSGKVGSKEYQALTDYFGISGDSLEDQYAWMQKYTAWFSDAEQGTKNFLQYIGQMSDEIEGIKFNDDGSFWFDPSKLDQIAKSLGLTKGALVDLLNNVRTYYADWESYSAEDLNSWFLDAGVIEQSGDSLIIYADKIREIASALGFTEAEIDEMIRKVQGLDEYAESNPVVVDFQFDGTEKFADVRQTFKSFLSDVENSGASIEKQKELILQSFEGLSPEVIAQIIPMIKDDELQDEVQKAADEQGLTAEVTVETTEKSADEKVADTITLMQESDGKTYSSTFEIKGLAEAAEDAKTVKELLDYGKDRFIDTDPRKTTNNAELYKIDEDPRKVTSNTGSYQPDNVPTVPVKADTEPLKKDVAEVELPPVKTEVELDDESAQARMQELGNQINELFNGNIDYNKRPHVSPQAMWDAGYTEFPASDVATTYSYETGVDAVEYPIVFEITPITEDGKVLTQEEVDNYIASLDLTGGINEFLASDAEKLNLVMHAVPGEYDEAYWQNLIDQYSAFKGEYEDLYAEFVGYDWEIEATADTDQADSEIDNFVSDAESKEITVPVVTSTTEESTVEPEKPSEEKQGGFVITPTTDTSKASDEVKEFTDHVESESVEIPMAADLSEAESQAQSFADGLTESPKPVTVKPEVTEETEPVEIPTEIVIDQQQMADVKNNFVLEPITVDTTQAEASMGTLNEASSVAKDGVNSVKTAEDELSGNALNLAQPIGQIGSLDSTAVTAKSNIIGIENEWNTLAALPDITKTINIQKNGDIAASAGGTKNFRGGLTLLGDEYNPAGEARPELVVANGEAYIAGADGPTIANLPKGAVVYPYKETKKILANNRFKGSLSGAIPAFSGGSNFVKNSVVDQAAKNGGTVVYNDYSTTYDTEIDGTVDTSGASGFTALIKSEEFKKFVDDFLNGTEQLQTAFDNLAGGADAGEVFDTLYDYFKEDSEALQILGERYDFTTDKVKALNDLVRTRVIENFNGQFGKLSTEQDIAALQDYMATILDMGKVTETIINLDTFGDKMNNLYSAIKESVAGTGLTADSIAELQDRYKGLENFDPSVLFERSYNGIHLNTTALRELESEYQNLTKSKITSHLASLRNEYKRLTQAIENCADETERAGFYAQRNDIQDQIDDTETLMSQYEGLTSVYQKWKDAQSMGEEGDMYDDVTANLENILELYKDGLVGTNEFRAAVQMLTNEDVSNWSAAELVDKFESSFPVLIKYLGETKEPLKQFLSDVQAINSEWAYIDENGLWQVHLPDDNALADAMGLNVETIQMILRKLSDYGFEVNLDMNIDTAQEELDQIQEAEVGDKGYDVVISNDPIGDLDDINSYQIDDKSYKVTAVETSSDSSSTESGEAAADGAAFAGGTGQALVGELGEEMLVRNGKWYLLGQDGAEFFDYRKGDIIFNADQTRRLLSNGKLDSGKRRGEAFALGTAQGRAFSDVSGAYQLLDDAKNAIKLAEKMQKDIDKNKKGSSSSSSSSRSSSSSSSSSSDTSEPEKFDWIEVAIKRATEALERFKKIADSAFKTLSTRLGANRSEIKQVTDEITLQQKAYARYLKEANSIGLSDNLKKQVREGAIDIQLYDDATRDLITEYQEWYEKSIQAKDAIDDLHESLSELYQERFDNIQSNYNDQLGVYEQRIDALANSSFATVLTNNANASQTIKELTGEIGLLSKEAVELNKALNEAVSSGGIQQYSEAWYQMKSDIVDVEQSLRDAYDDIASAYEERFKNTEDYYSSQLSLYQDQIDALDNSSHVSTGNNNTNAVSQISLYKNELSILNQELRDLKQARDEAVNSGTIIKGSEAWFDMESSINGVIKSINEVHESIAGNFDTIFDNFEQHYSNYLKHLSNITTAYDNAIEKASESGYLESARYYEELSKVEQQNINTLTQEMASLQTVMDKAMSSGEIEKYSDSWWDMNLSIEDVAASIDEANIQLIKYANTMREIEWGHFDLLQSKISEITEESEFLLKLLDSEKLYEDNGQLNDNGLATAGLHAQNYDVAMVQADKYREEMLAINKQIANDPYNNKLIDRRNELIKLQRESILAAEDEKKALKSLAEEGINTELKGLQDLISAYTDSLNSSKELRDYQKNVESQAKNIANLRKQMSAFSNDDSEESRARIQKLEVDLADAEAELAETEYDHFITDVTKLLDDLYTDYESILNGRLDNIDGLISSMLVDINAGANTIWSTIQTSASNVGYDISSTIDGIWNRSDGVNGVVSTYGEGISGQLTNVGIEIDGIGTLVQDQILHSDAIAADVVIGASILSADASEINKSIQGLDASVKKLPTELETGVGGVTSALEKNTNVINSTLNSILEMIKKSETATSKSITKATDTATKAVADTKPKATTTPAATKTATTTNTAKENIKYIGSSGTGSFWDTYERVTGKSYEELHAQAVASTAASAYNYASSAVNNGLASKFQQLGNLQNNTTVNVNIDHVDDYNDLMTKIQNDGRFPQLIQSMTLDQLVGKSSLSKYGYSWK